MSTTTTRKCSECKQNINIDFNNVHNVVLYKGKYYHSDCFVDMCTRKLSSSRTNTVEWQNAVDNVFVLENEALEKLNEIHTKEMLNDYLLDNYNIISVPKRLWYTISDLGNGIYKGQKCKPINMNVVLDMWQWGIKKLKAIELKHIGPTDGNSRVIYDLAVLVNHAPDYYQHLKQIEIMNAEAKRNKQNEINIDYGKIKTQNKTNGLDDISNLLDDLI